MDVHVSIEIVSRFSVTMEYGNLGLVVGRSGPCRDSVSSGEAPGMENFQI